MPADVALSAEDAAAPVVGGYSAYCVCGVNGTAAQLKMLSVVAAGDRKLPLVAAVLWNSKTVDAARCHLVGWCKCPCCHLVDAARVSILEVQLFPCLVPTLTPSRYEMPGLHLARLVPFAAPSVFHWRGPADMMHSCGCEDAQQDAVVVGL
ncbi:hypothetical protein Nepgr_021107 [Nepenthes gracilis]|uniref:Uncharacterized protein n=1 Tax=Nepenthes gracilis TaxID=150966 RepID=A0AAD3T0A2_NEPGR|nr:hypothetical protein Nepgr_021107 [Nepenthes gracilis]